MIDFNATLEELIEQNDSDFYLFSGSISDQNADKFISQLRKKEGKRQNCSLVLTTYGGDPDAGYRIIRRIKYYYDKLFLYALGTCKSTGTLMALGADEIVMSDFSEFGPLDIQLTKDDELSNTSGLNLAQSLMSLNEQLFLTFEHNFLGLKQKSGFTITTKTAAEISSKLAVGIIAPISAQIDPVKLGEVNRAIRIAREYGQRLSDDKELILRLIVGYPSHGFVIDFEEASEIFPNVRWVNDNESILEQFLTKYVRKEIDDDIIYLLEPEKNSQEEEEEEEEEEVPVKEETKEVIEGAEKINETLQANLENITNIVDNKNKRNGTYQRQKSK